jgi:hypothetical protein
LSVVILRRVVDLYRFVAVHANVGAVEIIKLDLDLRGVLERSVMQVPLLSEDRGRQTTDSSEKLNWARAS